MFFLYFLNLTKQEILLTIINEHKGKNIVYHHSTLKSKAIVYLPKRY